jgi:hypothetical protein
MLPTDIEDQLLLRNHQFSLASVRVTTKLLFNNDHKYSSLSLLRLTTLNQATNPIDRIYGLFGVAMDSADFQEPDYSLSVAGVYTQIVLTWIRRDHNL